MGSYLARRRVCTWVKGLSKMHSILLAPKARSDSSCYRLHAGNNGFRKALSVEVERKIIVNCGLTSEFFALEIRTSAICTASCRAPRPSRRQWLSRQELGVKFKSVSK